MDYDGALPKRALKKLTGWTHRRKQREELRRMGIKFLENSKDLVVYPEWVERATIEGSKQPPSKKEEPNYEALRDLAKRDPQE